MSKIAENLKRQIAQIKNGVPRGESPFRTSMNKKPSTKELAALPNISKNTLIRSSSNPVFRGKLVRGNNFDGDKLINMTRAKVL